MQKYGKLEDDDTNTVEEKNKYTCQNQVLLEYEDIMQEMANHIEQSKSKMGSRQDEYRLYEERIRKLKEKSKVQYERLAYLDQRISELNELGFTEAKYNPLNYEERVLENQV